MKNLFSNRIIPIRIFITLLLAVSSYFSNAQHIQYRHKIKPVESKESSPPENKSVPVQDNKVKIISANPIAKTDISKDSSKAFKKSNAALNMNPRPKKPYVEDHNICNLVSGPNQAPQLPLIINNVSPPMIALLKERYKGRLYSITGLNMIDERLKFKLKLCDKDNAKFRSEYLDKDGNVVNDPDFDYD
jgi:hypothetical protein